MYYLHFYTNGISKSHTQKAGKARAEVVPVAQSLHQRELVPMTVGVKQLPGPRILLGGSDLALRKALQRPGTQNGKKVSGL